MNSQAILIFDQEEAVRDSLSLVLSEEGYQCFTAKTESGALNILQSNSVGLVILDIQVLRPAFLKKIKTRCPHTKIMILSSYTEIDATQQALSAGADDFVLKPLDFDELLAYVKILILKTVG